MRSSRLQAGSSSVQLMESLRYRRENALRAVSPGIIFWPQTKHLIGLSHIFPRCHGSSARTWGRLFCCGCPSCASTGRLQLPLLLLLPASAAQLPFGGAGSVHLCNLCSTPCSESGHAGVTPGFHGPVLFGGACCVIPGWQFGCQVPAELHPGRHIQPALRCDPSALLLTLRFLVEGGRKGLNPARSIKWSCIDLSPWQGNPETGNFWACPFPHFLT